MTSQGNEHDLNLSDGSPPRKKIRKSLNRRSMLPDGMLPLVENIDTEGIETSASEVPQPPSAFLNAAPAFRASEAAEVLSKTAPIAPSPDAKQSGCATAQASDAKCDVSDLEVDIALRCIERYAKEVKAWKALEESYSKSFEKALKSEKFCSEWDNANWKDYLPDKDREKVEEVLDYGSILKKADRSFKKTVCVLNDIGFEFRKKQAAMRKIEANVQAEARALRLQFLGDVTARPM